MAQVPPMSGPCWSHLELPLSDPQFTNLAMLAQKIRLGFAHNIKFYFVVHAVDTE